MDQSDSDIDCVGQASVEDGTELDLPHLIGQIKSFAVNVYIMSSLNWENSQSNTMVFVQFWMKLKIRRKTLWNVFKHTHNKHDYIQNVDRRRVTIVDEVGNKHVRTNIII